MKRLLLTITAAFLAIVGVASAQPKTDPNLSAKQRSIVLISAFTAKGDLQNLKSELNAGLDAGLTINESKEVLLHLYAYCGFPRSIRGMQTLMTVVDERKEKGIKDPEGRVASPITDSRSRSDRGEANQVTVTQRSIEELRGGYAAFSPEMAAFLREHLFADLFDRDVLNFQEREITTVSALISQGGVEPMVKSHFIGSLNVGVTAEQLNQLVELIGSRVEMKDADAAKPILIEVLKSREK